MIYFSSVFGAEAGDPNPQPTVYLPRLYLSREWDSNPRPMVYDTIALPLSYPGESWRAIQLLYQLSCAGTQASRQFYH